MNLSTGRLLFYGGILGIIMLSILTMMLIIAYKDKGKKLIKKIQEEY